MGSKKARKRLACIRCVLDTVSSIKQNKPLPKELCFVPKTVDYGILPDLDNKTGINFCIWSSPKDGALTGRISVAEEKLKDFSITVYGKVFSNTAGDWVQIYPESIGSISGVTFSSTTPESWLLIQQRESKLDSSRKLVPKHEITNTSAVVFKEDIFGGSTTVKDGKKYKNVYKWMQVVEQNYMLHIFAPSLPANADLREIEHLSQPPTNWSWEADEELVRFLVDHSCRHDVYAAGARNYVESINVSSEQESAHNLIDNDPDTYWESDGSSGRHHIQLEIKQSIIIQKMIIGVDQTDDNYMPSRVLVFANTQDSNKLLNEVRIDGHQDGDVVILENATEFYPQIEIRIKECKDDGIDCRIHYLKIVSSKQKQCGLNYDQFSKDLVRYPLLETVDKSARHQLYCRAQALHRFIVLFDSVIQYLLPMWEYTAGTYKCLEELRQLLPLSHRRQGLIENCLRETQGVVPSNMPKIYINRHAAAQHLVDPTADPQGKNSVFYQLYEALRPEWCEMKLDYRWPQKYDQWWECKFIGEGIIDQGGGFRDSLSDLSEELCPSSTDALLPLPYFVRSPNQASTSNIFRDCYVPNASCNARLRYQWIGNLMGACLRGSENLILTLPPIIWKMLNGEKVTWEKDYHTVDATEVKLLDAIEKMTEEEFIDSYDQILTFTTVLSNGSVVPLKGDSSSEFVTYQNREEYIKLVKEKRMAEFDCQVNAMRSGLEKVVPKAVLTLVTWQELEKRVCGDPVITLEALKKSAHYEDFENDAEDSSVKFLWQAIENFTNEDRSRFLRFVTGRRRLPTPLFICSSKSPSPPNSLPESATCSNTLFLPTYTSVEHAEERIRYASYNCIAIDTDMSPWED